MKIRTRVLLAIVLTSVGSTSCSTGAQHVESGTLSSSSSLQSLGSTETQGAGGVLFRYGCGQPLAQGGLVFAGTIPIRVFFTDSATSGDLIRFAGRLTPSNRAEADEITRLGVVGISGIDCSSKVVTVTIKDGMTAADRSTVFAWLKHQSGVSEVK